MSKHIPQIAAQHRQAPRRLDSRYERHAVMKTCPSCGELFYATDLHSVHVVSSCRVIRRRVRAAAAGAA